MGEKKAKFSLSSVITGIEAASEECRYFANRETGEIVSDFDKSFLGEEADEYYFDGDEWLCLPDSFDRDDWRTMRDYAYALGGSAEDEILDAIHSRGAFRSFRRLVEGMGALNSWYAYKDQRIYELAVEWLDENNLPYEDDCHENQKRNWRDLLPDSMRYRLGISVLEERLSVCKYEEIPHEVMGEGFFFIARTTEEVSVVCESGAVPDGAINREDGWRALKVEGPLDFELVGILAKISSALANAGVPLFAMSTFDTDYVLVKENNLDTAMTALRREDIDVLA